MATITTGARAHLQPTMALLRAFVVLLTLGTAAVHASLGGVLFLANAAGYVAFAAAMVLPGRIGQLRWLVRLALVGFTATTIGAWFLFGARFPLAYLDKGLEIALIVVLAIELWQADGGPAGIAERVRQLVKRLATPFLARLAR